MPPVSARKPGRSRRRRNKEAAKIENEVEETPTNSTDNHQDPPKALKLGRKGNAPKLRRKGQGNQW